MFVENLDAFFDVDEHAISVTYTPKGHAHPGDASSTITVILDRNAYDVGAGGSVDVSSRRSLALAKASDVSGVEYGAKLRDDAGNDYRIVNHDPEETGDIMELLLERI